MNGLGVFSYAASVFSYAPSWWVLGFMLVVFFCYAGVFGFLIFLLSTCLVLCRPCFFLCAPSPRHALSINILFMLTLCMENVIGRMCKLCTCTRPGVPRLVDIYPMAFTHRDMVLEVPLKRCVVHDVATSLKLKRSPRTEHQHSVHVDAHTPYGMHGMI